MPDGTCAHGGRTPARVLFLAVLASFLLNTGISRAQSTDAFPGGFLEKATSAEVRPVPSASEIQGFMPSRGAFTFPSPWYTEGARITNSSDCGGTDCVLPVGYSYWRNMNNHAGSDTILIFLGLNPDRGGTGPTLFSYNKVTEEVRNLGPLFASSDPLRWSTAEGWYFSATMPNALYLNSGSRMLRYDVITKQMTTVYDAATRFGSGYFIWQMHSSNDDNVHIATLRSSSSSAMMGCLAYREDTAQFSYYPARGKLDECHLDRSGRWMVMLDNVDGAYGEDNRIIDLTTGAETLLLDQNGAAGHADVGYGYIVNEDDWNAEPGAVRLWNLGPLSSGGLMYHVTDWNVDVGHISHTNARAGVPTSQQYACSSNATRGGYPRANEVVCWRLDGSMDVLVVAPVMTNLDAAGGGDDYSKDPKGNLDVTGQYMIWTTNLGTGRLDAVVVKVPAHRLVGPADTTAPTVTLTAPAGGATVSGAVTLAASASDNVGVAGVQFRVDGAAVGSEDPAAPFTASWSTLSMTAGSHTLTATARDGAGNTTVSAPVTVQVSNPPPAISSIAFSSVSSAGAVVTWVTDRPSDTQVEYGTTTAYGSTTPLGTAMVTSHSQTLSGLTAGTLYHVRVRSADGSGQALSTDQTVTTSTSTIPTLPGGLIGQWKFDEPGGTAAVDSSGHAYHGTIYNGALRVPGRVGGALQLDGVNDYVDIPHRASMDAYPMTLTAWVRTKSTGLAGVVNKYLPSSFNGYQLFVNGGQVCAWYFRDAGNNVWNGTGCTMPVAGLNDDTWHHMAVVLEDTGGKLYVDGVLKGSQSWKGAPGAATTSVGLSIGRYPGVSSPYFAGAVDDVRLYGRALEAVEIAAIVNEADSTADTTPPAIGSLAPGSVTSMSAVVGWVTSEPADTVVEYGPTTAYGARLADTALSLSHSRTLTGLTASTTYHFRVTSRDAAGNMAVSPDGTFTTAAAVATGTQDVQWTQVVNCTVTGSDIQKTAGYASSADAGAVSAQSISSGDGFLEFTVPEAGTLRYAGLSSGMSGVLPGEIEFAIRLQSGIAEVRESGTYMGDVPAVAGDVFRVAVSGGQVTYARNGVVFHTSARTPVYPLVGNVALIDSLSSVSQVRIGTGS